MTMFGLENIYWRQLKLSESLCYDSNDKEIAK